MIPARQSLKENISALLTLISGSTREDFTAAHAIDLITWAVEEAKSNAKPFVDADGFNHVAWLLAKAAPTERDSTDLLLPQKSAADLVSRVCNISQQYVSAALKAGILGTLLNLYRSGNPVVRPAAFNALFVCVDMLEEIAQAPARILALEL